MFDVFMVARLGFFLVAVGYTHAANSSSEENEYGIRLYTRRHRCCRFAVLLALRTIAG